MVDICNVHIGDRLYPSEYAFQHTGDIREDHKEAFNYFLKNGNEVLDIENRTWIRLKPYMRTNVCLTAKWFDADPGRPDETEFMDILT